MRRVSLMTEMPLIDGARARFRVVIRDDPPLSTRFGTRRRPCYYQE